MSTVDVREVELQFLNTQVGQAHDRLKIDCNGNDFLPRQYMFLITLQLVFTLTF